MVPVNHQEKSYCQKSGFLKHTISQIFKISSNFFFQCIIHIQAHIFGAQKIVSPCRTDGAFKKKYFWPQTSFYAQILGHCAFNNHSTH